MCVCLERFLERMENLGEKEVLMGVWRGVEKNVMGFRCFSPWIFFPKWGENYGEKLTNMSCPKCPCIFFFANFFFLSVNVHDVSGFFFSSHFFLFLYFVFITFFHSSFFLFYFFFFFKFFIAFLSLSLSLFIIFIYLFFKPVF